MRQSAALLLACALTCFAQLPLEPTHNSGQSITAAYEGWYHNPDGSFTLLIGYYNRNQKQEVDIPIGPANKIEPGGPDQGQPTHFVPGRQWGMFTVKVPKEFGDKKLTWTLTTNGQTTQVPFSINELWELAPFGDATGNTPPYVGFSESGPFSFGPRAITSTMKASVGQPLSITAFAADDAKRAPGTNPLIGRQPAVTLTWTKFRGPGTVTFSNTRLLPQKADFSAPATNVTFTGKGTTTATFSDPGEYILRLAGNDSTGEGGGGFQCCWTSAYVKVSVQ
jgi:hypothetical protein